jgi:hypothetical protein
MYNMSPDGTTWIITCVVFGVVLVIGALLVLIGHIAEQVAIVRKERWQTLGYQAERDIAREKAIQARCEEAVVRKEYWQTLGKEAIARMGAKEGGQDV